jgi:FtsP/CotA-like multicopper oxidase with cupredoxin domain
LAVSAIASLSLLSLTHEAVRAQEGPDVFGPPPAGDPSAFTGPSVGLEGAVNFLSTQPETIEGSLEGGDPAANGAIAEQDLLSGGQYDVPTGSAPSPLFGALPFQQRMILFEEFGTDALDEAVVADQPFPGPTAGPAPAQDPDDPAASSPAGEVLDAFFRQAGISPFPTRFANTIELNPWRAQIEAFLGRPLDTPPAEGRPPGKGWAHQRWDEFPPSVYFQTVQAGARTNGGLRDARQRHRYSVGEFAPGGLYNTVYDSEVAGAPVLRGTTNGLSIRIHPNMPIQSHKSVWTFDGTLPPKLLVGRYGEGILMRHYNALPIDPSANRGFGLHTISTHEHNGHNPAESDGFAGAFFFPGQFYDYRWPMQLAGYDTVNTRADDPKAGFPCTPGETLYVNDEAPGVRVCDNSGRINVRGDYRETMSTHWFHDHMIDFTAQNVYKGNAVMFNYYSAIDRGNEAVNDGVNLRLPSGSGLSWGNRDYDINLVIADKAWDATGQLWFNIFNKDGFLGDQLLTNWLYKPYFEVRARRYRLRILNGSVSRYFALALVKQVAGNGGEFPGPAGSGVSYNRIGFHMVANDGNLMEHAVPFDGTLDLDGDGDRLEHKGKLPTQSIAERYDIVVDFASQGIRANDKLYFVNLLEHQTGIKAGNVIPLASVLSGAYAPTVQGGRWTNGDPAVGRFLEFRVRAYAGVDQSMNPANYVPGRTKMIPLPFNVQDPNLLNARHRTFEFGRSGGTDTKPWTVRADGGVSLTADSRRLTAAPQLATGPTAGGFSGTNAAGFDNFGRTEVWSIVGNGGWSHPVHVHFEEGVILSRDGRAPPVWEKWARKDVFRIGPEADSSQKLEIALRFREFAGSYVEHCHNTQHEDNAMLMRWDLEHPGQVQLMPAPIPTWDGVEYVDSHALPTFRIGDGAGPKDPLPSPGGTVSNVNIKVATNTLSAGQRLLTVSGEAKGAGWVALHGGALVNGTCSGNPLGVQAVADPVKGLFAFGLLGLNPMPGTVCVRASTGRAASKSVTVR